MQNNLIDQGLELMLYGMGMVFVFLAVLIVVTMIMSALVQRFAHSRASEAQSTALPAAQSTALPTALSADSDRTLIAVITAAIHQHRARRK